MISIGIDIGTTAVKILALDENGQVLKTVSRDYPLYMYDNGYSEQSPEDWWNETIAGLNEITNGLGEVSAVSFSGQMHGLVLLDENDNVLRRAILWNDQRTTKECEYLNNEIGRDFLLENVANIALTGFTAPKIMWVKENEPSIWENVSKIMLPKDYIAYKLSGVFATDYSDASGMLLLDVKNQDWSDKMLNVVGVKRELLPKLFHSYEVIGNVTIAAASQTGLSVNTKVVIGGGDQSVGAIGSGIVKEGMCSVSLGTSGVVFVATDEFAVDNSPAAIHSFCHATGKFHFMGVTLSAAGSNKWWVEEILTTSDYSGEQEKINKIGTNPVFFLPYLAGERTPHNDPYARGAFVGMNVTTTRADMVLAILEGVSFSLRDILTRIHELGVGVKTARIIGGGAKSALWCQIVADVLNLKVEKVQSEEGPAFGAAILAMVGAGQFANIQEACEKLINITEMYVPNKENAVNYNRNYPIYVNLYNVLKDSFHTISKEVTI